MIGDLFATKEGGRQKSADGKITTPPYQQAQMKPNADHTHGTTSPTPLQVAVSKAYRDRMGGGNEAGPLGIHGPSGIVRDPTGETIRSQTHRSGEDAAFAATGAAAPTPDHSGYGMRPPDVSSPIEYMPKLPPPKLSREAITCDSRWEEVPMDVLMRMTFSSPVECDNPSKVHCCYW